MKKIQLNLEQLFIHDEISDDIIVDILSNIENTDLETIYNLDELKTWVLRSKLGVFSNGAIKTSKEVSEDSQYVFIRKIHEQYVTNQFRASVRKLKIISYREMENRLKTKSK